GAYGVVSLYNSYQKNQTLQLLTRLGMNYIKNKFFPQSEQPKVISQEDLKKALTNLVEKLRTKTRRTDLDSTVFVELLKQEVEFANIYCDLKKKNISPEKLADNIKTVQDYATRDFQMLIEHIEPLLKKNHPQLNISFL